MNDIDNVFNLMSYYSASTFIYKGVDDDKQFWINQFLLSNPSYGELIKLLTTLEEINLLLQKSDTITDSSWLGGLFQVRIAHLALARISVNSKFTIEGSDIFKSIDAGAPTEFITIGQDAYVKSSLLQETFYPIGIINSNSLQIVQSKNKFAKSEKVRVVVDARGAEWSRKQDIAIRELGVEAHKIEDAKNYRDVGIAIANGRVDIAAVPAPLNFLAKIYGYKTSTLPQKLFFTNALLLVRKDIAREMPGNVKAIMNECKQRYSEFGGSQTGDPMFFEHFVGISAAHQLNNYCREKILAVSNKEFRSFVESNKSTLDVI
jgi:hypothetical protein